MNNYYNINYARIGVLLLPTFLRKSLMVSFVKSMMKPLDELNKSFTVFHESLDTNTYSQVCYMQGALNDYFDPLERRIKIKQTSLDKASFLYWRQAKNRPAQLRKENTIGFKPRMEYNEAQIGSNNIDFEIVLPIGFNLSENEETYMRTLVNKNKLTSKTYTIKNE